MKVYKVQTQDGWWLFASELADLPIGTGQTQPETLQKAVTSE